MKNFFILTIVLSALLITADSCKKDKEITCNMNAGPKTVSQDMTVIYTAHATGDGTISSLTYETDSGSVIINNPSLPWLKSVTITNGNTIHIQGTGNVKDGEIVVRFDALGETEMVLDSNTCEHHN